MPPKKKLKNAEDGDFKEGNLPGPCKEEHLDPNIESYSTLFSLLPVDVLLYLYKFLSSADILSLSQLGDPKLSEIAEIQRKVNFSVCRRTSFELMSSYFSRERIKYIQKLNFNFNIFAKPSDLVQIICRCKNLIVLSVIECGINHKQLIKILDACSVLKELSWDIKETDYEERYFCHSSLAKLYLFSSTCSNPGALVGYILKSFPRIENIVLCCSQDALIVPPFITLWSKSISFSCNHLRLVTVIKNSLTDKSGGVLMHVKCEKKKNKMQNTSNPEEGTSRQEPVAFGGTPRQQSVTYDGRSYRIPKGFGVQTLMSDACYNHPPYLKVKTCEKDLEMLASCNSNSYSTVTIHCVTNTLSTYERFFESISKVVGSKLKHLSIECETKTILKPLNTPALPDEIHQNISNMLETVFLNCENITVLNFGEIHFTSGSPLKAISSIKNLEVLLIPTCAIPKRCTDVAGSSSQENQDQGSIFEEMISKCWKVSDFHLICCNSDVDLLKDSDICPIQNWRCLASFSIYNVIFKTCLFLRKIADSCLELQSFSLIRKAPRSGYILYYDVMYLLRHAKKLSFIRINEESFNPTFGPFMTAVSSAKNLEGICFMTQLTTAFSTLFFIDSLQPLKYLHLFHFNAPRVPDRLYVEVRKLMDGNGIKNIKIEKDCDDGYKKFEFDPYKLDDLFVHIRPSLHCKHLHLNKCLSDSFSSF